MKIGNYLTALVLGIAGCNNILPDFPEPAPAKNVSGSYQSQNDGYETKLKSARRIVVDEKVLSIGKDYDVLVDGQKVATVSGKDWRMPFSGDAFVLKTLNGKVLASEKEHLRWARLNRAASVYDGQGNLTGYLGEEVLNDLFSWGYILHFYNAQQQELGKSEKIGRGAIDFHRIYNTSGREDYAIDHKFTVVGDKYELTVANPNSQIPLEQALLLVCIEDAIKDSQVSKENSSDNEDDD